MQYSLADLQRMTWSAIKGMFAADTGLLLLSGHCFTTKSARSPANVLPILYLSCTAILVLCYCTAAVADSASQLSRLCRRAAMVW